MNDNFVQVTLLSIVVTVVLQFSFWLLHIRHRNAGYVDLGWAMSVGIVSILSLILGEGDFAKRILLCAFPMVWSLRLSLLIAARLGPESEEDARYTHLRNRLGAKFALTMLPFFLFQALLAVILSLPVLYGSSVLSSHLSFAEACGVIVMLIALMGEITADLQLAAFKNASNQNDGVCRRGLWAYSRHPNYFFEWLFWVGLGIFTMTFSFALVFSILSPTIMFVLLTRVTGIPPTEAISLKKRPEAYARYQKEVSAFFPWFSGEKGRK